MLEGRALPPGIPQLTFIPLTTHPVPTLCLSFLRCLQRWHVHHAGAQTLQQCYGARHAAAVHQAVAAQLAGGLSMGWKVCPPAQLFAAGPDKAGYKRCPGGIASGKLQGKSFIKGMATVPGCRTKGRATELHSKGMLCTQQQGRNWGEGDGPAPISAQMQWQFRQTMWREKQQARDERFRQVVQEGAVMRGARGHGGAIASVTLHKMSQDTA